MTDVPHHSTPVVPTDFDHEADAPEVSTAAGFADKLPALPNLDDYRDKVGDLSSDWYDWAEGIAVGPLTGIHDVIEAASMGVGRYLPWRTLLDGTRTHRVDGTDGELARLKFILAQPWDLGPDTVMSQWSAADLTAAEGMARRATRDRLMLGSAKVAHGEKISLADFLQAAAKAYAYTDPATLE